MTCLHCGDAPCAEVCPTWALYIDRDGAVVLDEEACIGCMMCAIACPFGIPRFDPRTNTMVKCDLCTDRRRRGKQPACVEHCPADAIIFGEVNEIAARIRVEKSLSKLARALRRV